MGSAAMGTPLATLLLLLGLALTSALSVAKDTGEPLMYPFGLELGDAATPTEDDGMSPEISIDVPFSFYGQRYRGLYVNNNGVVSFGVSVAQYTPDPFPLADGRPFVAPYWGDVDTRLGGHVYYRQSRDATLLRRLTRDLRAYFPGIHFTATWALVATWDHVAFFGAATTVARKENTFQAVLATDGDISFIMLNYEDIQWTTGIASGGDPLTGLGGTAAQAGFNSGDNTHYYNIPGSRTDNVLNIQRTSNVGVPGRWVFQVDVGISTVAPSTAPPAPPRTTAPPPPPTESSEEDCLE
ncbi:sushi, nidogen and EGF-like domain-containing protein 1 [Alligator mississippiensis]|uniref:Sushi, nidogen and EGF-like domain-containing protein 1 n=1 Tax=Alligator mississippiensis TaxID=8496 RepID=A0A151MNY7_ALLMI|nr:sushi, nidogen and EGF-like domain-containing protein 1 [Alligator mississippiensis]KYO26244.1 sushi, nidogen and EGF-like domain-containing protein 1 [Alligator mississippiensis]